MSSGSAARRELAQVARHGGWPMTRGARLGRPARPDFATLRTLPRWPALDPARQQRVATVALLIGAQSALGRLIDGARLRGYAMLVGAPVLERLWTLEDGGRDPLPPIEALPHAADRLLRAAATEAEARQRMGQAEALLKELDAWPFT